MMVKAEKLISSGKKCWKNGVPRLYVLAREINVRLAIATVSALKTSGHYPIDNEWEFSIPRKRGKFGSYVALKRDGSALSV